MRGIRHPGKFANQPRKTRRINDFAGLLAPGEELEDLLSNHFDESFCIASRHVRLHDEICRYIDKVPNFPRAPLLVYELFRSRGH